MLQTSITAIVALLGVTLGSWLTYRNQDRLWHRDHERQWRDIRLAALNEFSSAYREFIAYVLDPVADIQTSSDPRQTGELFPIFNEEGRRYRERLESTSMRLRLVAQSPQVLRECKRIVVIARKIAAARATHSAGSLPSETFDELWEAQKSFVTAARRELGLSSPPSIW